MNQSEKLICDAYEAVIEQYDAYEAVIERYKQMLAQQAARLDLLMAAVLAVGDPETLVATGKVLDRLRAGAGRAPALH